MTEAKFIEKYHPTWEALETSLRSKSKSFESITERINLYRAVSGHLSYAQSAWGCGTLCNYLGELTGRAHAEIYAHMEKPGIGSFFKQTIPRQLRENTLFIVISAAIFVGATILSYALTYVSLDFAYAFLPEQYAHLIPADNNEHSIVEPNNVPASTMASYVMVNNIRVTVLAFGLGLTLGLGTIYVLATNGFLLGSLAAIFTVQGNTLLFWSLILPHGIWELAAIFVSGGAGLKLGYALIRPGLYRRQDALLAAARNVTGLIAFIIILLINAAIIEGFFTPAPFAPILKLVFAAFTGLVLIIYCIYVWHVNEASASKKDNALLNE